MKLALVNFFYDENSGSEAALLSQYYTMTGWAESLQRAGAEVTVISRFNTTSELEQNGVRYFFIKDGLGARFSSLEFPLKFLKAVAALNADVVHLHHFTLSLHTLMLRYLLHKKTAIIIQHHGGRPPKGWKIKLHNLFNRVADGYFFTSFQQCRDWFGSKMEEKKIMPVMEGSSFFDFESRDAGRDYSWQHRDAARALTGIQGKPVFLWVGRLDENKDPLTVLRGFEMLASSHGSANLYMIYSDHPLESDVKQMIEASPVLKKSVHLLGKIPHNKLLNYYNSADYFVTGSHYEGSSYALSEALSCGCIPVVTDIPSLRAMTDNGSLGSLWSTGDAHSFAQAALKALQKPVMEEAWACIRFYQENLSWPAIARQAIAHYRNAIDRRARATR